MRTSLAADAVAALAHSVDPKLPLSPDPVSAEGRLVAVAFASSAVDIQQSETSAIGFLPSALQ